MNKIYRIGDLINDDLATWSDELNRISQTFLTRKSLLVNPDDYDITPKKSTVERQIKEKEQRLQELKDRRANEQRWFDEREKQLNDEIYDLRKKLSP
jgi:hypothetical protein